MISLRKKLACDLHPNDKVVITNVVKVNIVVAIKGILEERKVSAFFNNVDDIYNISQLNKLCGMKEWFCEEVKLLLPHEIEMVYLKIMRTTR